MALRNSKLLPTEETGPERQLPESGAGEHRTISRKGKFIGGAILLALIAIAFFFGYLPRHRRNKQLAAEAKQRANAIPQVSVVKATPAPASDRLSLPGTMTALIEAPIFARASGYIKLRKVDIGDDVHRGQLMALIDAPDVDRQVDQQRATLLQSQSALGQVKAQLDLAKVTRDRYLVLVKRGVLSRQDGDTQQANYEVATANLRAAENAVKANQANLARLEKLQSYEQVVAPFDGTVTARNIDVGSLISTTGSGQPASDTAAGSAGSPPTGGSQGGELFRVAKLERLRVFISVPESYVPFVRVGMPAEVESPSLPGEKFKASVTRTANSIDPNTRTLLTELQVDSNHERLKPGMYAITSLLSIRSKPPLAVPADALIARGGDVRLAVVRDNIVHLVSVIIGRDYGPFTEILSGINEGDLVVMNPSDRAQEGAKVNPKIEQVQEGSAKGEQQQQSASGGQYVNSPTMGQSQQQGGKQQGGEKGSSNQQGNQGGQPGKKGPEKK